MSDLILRNDTARTITFTEEVRQLRDDALGLAQIVTTVRDADTQEIAVEAQRSLRSVLKTVEDARKTVKAPLLDFGRAIDKSAKDFVEAVEAEELRVAKMIGDFQQAEIARAKSAEAANAQALTDMEREREAALATAPTLEDRERIQEEFSQRVADLPVVAPVRADGQCVREDWEITVTDVWALARAHPMAVKVEPRLSEIRQLLDAGVKVAGVSAKKTTKASVRLREPKAIEVGA